MKARLSDVIASLAKKKQTLGNIEVEGIIVNAANGNIVLLAATLPAQEMTKLVEMFDK